MLSLSCSPQSTPSGEPAQISTCEVKFPWFAVRTRTGSEKLTYDALTNKGLIAYLPTYRSRRRWSDRVVVADMPLFQGYVFSRFDPLHRLPVLTSAGVMSIVGFGSDPTPIDEHEINAVRTILSSGLAAHPHPFLREGQAVRVKRGSLQGLEGILVKKKADFRLVISVPMLQRSVSVEIDREWIDPIDK